MLYSYGIEADSQLSPLEIELTAYRNNRPLEKGGLGPAGHFKNIVGMLWGPKSPRPFMWHPWAERMNEGVHSDPYTGQIRPDAAFSGCASSGKTFFGGAYAIVNWLCDPLYTTVLVTSTDLAAARKRIWGAVVDLYLACPGLPGKLVDSTGKICTLVDGAKQSELSGIFLIAAEKKKEKEAIGKIIGIKNERVVLILDELPELSPAIIEAAYGNLKSNPMCQVIAMGNFKGRYDPFGEYVQPLDGWDSLSVDSEGWQTAKGHCMRFDGLKSPNVLSGRDDYPRIYGSKQLQQHRKDFGEDTAMFWRMCRSYEAPVGTENTIYSKADLLAGQAYAGEPLWMSEPVRVASLDPSFTSGGDRAVQMIGKFGYCVDGVWRLFREKTLILRDNATMKVPRDYQIARQFRDNAIGHGVEPRNAALDTTGAGSVLYSIISEEWSRDVLPVNFSGAPSEIFVRANDTNTANKQFDRRVSELWWVGREFMRYGQIRGVDHELARELKARQYTHTKGVDGLKVSVEVKPDMKKRLGFSPDEADSFVVMIDLCRQRHKFLAGGQSTGERAADTSWDEQVKAANDMYEHVDYSEQPVII